MIGSHQAEPGGRSADGGPVAPTLVEAASYVLIRTVPELIAACDDWQRCPALGLDTEFVRTRTFYPALGLIQISDGERRALVDPLAIEDLDPVRRLLQRPTPIKVVHSCSEDLEALYHRFGEMPAGVFDTQVAAALLGHRSSIGYRALVQELFEVDLPKAHTRSDWLRRPLAEAQCRYAAMDVAYLLPIHRRLAPRLTELGRESWAGAEVARLRDVERFQPDPERAYLRLRASRRAHGRELAALQVLASWREREARRRDLPRNFVLGEAGLRALAKKRPRSRHELSKIRDLRPEEIRRDGPALLTLLQRSAESPPQLPAPEPGASISLTPHRGTLERMRQAVDELAREQGIPAELLASKRALKELLRRRLAGASEPWPQELRGWRQELLAGPILDRLEGLGGQVGEEIP